MKKCFGFTKIELLVVLIVSLGYFVDVYDLLLFSAVRRQSLTAIGVNDTDLTNIGLSLLNWQLLGMLIGGLVWGVIADKKGRRSVLFGSIIFYSAATFCNAYVESVFMYKIMRLIAGFGLAGELGVGIALVTEVVERSRRTYATTIVATFGILGGVLAASIASKMQWQTSYIIGGLMGVLLLVFRFNIVESDLFKKVYRSSVGKGNLLQLFRNPQLWKKYLLCILVGAPTYVFIGTFITLSPEFGKKLGLQTIPSAAISLIYFYVSLTLFDAVSGLLSKLMQSRKKVLNIFLVFQILAVITYLFIPLKSEFDFYLRCGLIGASLGYWTVFITNAAEQFGTNLRATVSTSAPNFARALQIPFSFLFKGLIAPIGIVYAGAVVGVISVGIGLFGVFFLQERFENDADYIE